MTYNRRQMVRLLAGIAAFVSGRPVSGQYNQMSQARRSNPPLVLVLDGQEVAIEVVYHGQRVTVTPQEVMDALRSK